MQYQAPPEGGDQQTFKMDVLFYNAYRKAKNFYMWRNLYHFVKLALVVVFLPIDIQVLETPNRIIVTWLGCAIGVQVFNIFVSLLIWWQGYGDNQINNTLFLNLARAHEHAIPEEPIRQADIRSMKLCVSSTIYNRENATHVNDEGLTDDIKARYEGVFANSIQRTVFEYSPCLSIFESFSKFGSFSIIVFGIVALAVSKPLPAEIGVGVAYMFLQVFSVWVPFVVILGLALSPLICFFGCIWCCCCAPRLEQNETVSIPPSAPATLAMIRQTDGTCSICFQNFELKEPVITLPCSTKHMFHEGCLSKWLNVSPSCPICRYRLTQQI